MVWYSRVKYGIVQLVPGKYVTRSRYKMKGAGSPGVVQGTVKMKKLSFIRFVVKKGTQTDGKQNKLVHKGSKEMLIKKRSFPNSIFRQKTVSKKLCNSILCNSLNVHVYAKDA